MLVLLESLSPVKRAVFLLREVFGYEYAEIARAVGKSEENCRQIAVRARRHVGARRPRFAADRRRREELLDRFLAAAERGDVAALRDMLAADAVLYSDGGGKALAARRPILGADRVARFMAGVTRKRLARGIADERPATVNGQPGRMVLSPDGGIWDVLTIDVAPEGVIQTVRIIRNPDKLRHLLHADAPAAAGAAPT